MENLVCANCSKSRTVSWHNPARSASRHTAIHPQNRHCRFAGARHAVPAATTEEFFQPPRAANLPDLQVAAEARLLLTTHHSSLITIPVAFYRAQGYAPLENLQVPLRNGEMLPI